jgi:hypothetical protein
VRFEVRPGDGPARIVTTALGWRAEGDAAGLAALLNRIAEQWPHVTAPECGGVAQSLAQLRRWLAGDGPEPNLPGAVVWEKEWDAAWEVERLLESFGIQSLDLLGIVDRSQPMTVTAFVSEPPEQRQRLAAVLRQRLVDEGFQHAEVVVLSAFKAGLSWLREVVIPALQAQPLPVGRVRISWRRHVADDTLDLPIRWLQELFPGPELMADALAIPLDAIELVEAPADADATFVAEAFDLAGGTLGRWDCTPPSRTQPFITALGDDAGQVVVTTGGVVVQAGGERYLDVGVPTDLETFWSFWQAEVIPDLLALVEQRGIARDAQPFFGELQAEVWVSEPNESLGVREENDSAAEALAEDIYFTTLDAIELYGLRANGEKLNAPGAVIPIVHVTPSEAPRARITLRAAPARPYLPYPSLTVNEVALDGDQFAIRVVASVDGDPAPTAQRLRQLADVDLSAGTASLAATLTLAGEEFRLRLPVTEPLRRANNGASEIPSPPMDENIWGDAVIDLAKELGRLPEITAWIEDESYQGRPIPALSLSAPTPGRLHSPLKASILKPTYLIVARHHANEISSTNAAFRLASLCVSDPEWRRYLDNVNVVILPYENPDGAALHARLSDFPEARTWKHHPARYNALGFEYGEDTFNASSRFGEARARTAVWRRWLPDVVVDNHGVPSHEWVQPFAGYGSPPRFPVSYWIVQALLYGIASYTDESEAQREAVEALRDAVSAKVRDTDIGVWNRLYGESYRFWGQAHLPERFPGEFHDDMLWHIRHAPADPEGRGYHMRYPKTTILSWVTEVNDETAAGEHLERVARAHLLANQATLDLLADAVRVPEARRIDHGDGTFTVRVGRDRPLRIRPDSRQDGHHA